MQIDLILYQMYIHPIITLKSKQLIVIYLVCDLVHLVIKVTITNVSLMAYRILFKRLHARLRGV